MKIIHHWPLVGVLLGSEHSPHMLLWETGVVGDWAGQEQAVGGVGSVELMLGPRQGVLLLNL